MRVIRGFVVALVIVALFGCADAKFSTTSNWQILCRHRAVAVALALSESQDNAVIRLSRTRDGYHATAYVELAGSYYCADTNDWKEVSFLRCEGETIAILPINEYVELFLEKRRVGNGIRH